MVLGPRELSFRPHIEHCKADGLAGLLDKCLRQTSKRRACRGEIEQLVQPSKCGFDGWIVAHFHRKYRSESQVRVAMAGSGPYCKAQGWPGLA